MYQSEKAEAKALNLQAVNHYLTRETSAAYVADGLDDIIFDFIHAIGEADENLSLPLKTIACHIYHLTRLRNLFLNVSIANNEPFELDRIINDCREY